MKVLFSNPPWWAKRERVQVKPGEFRQLFTGGVRAGSRWPFTFKMRSSPDHFEYGDYLPYPFFMGYAASYAAANTDAEVFFRDSIALRDSYTTFHKYVAEVQPDMIIIESATPSWSHDAALIRTLHTRYPNMKIAVTGPIGAKGQQILDTLPVVAVMRGEYEKGCVKVIEGAEGLIAFDLLTKAEMNAAPFPYYDRHHALRYFDLNPRGQKFPHAHVWSSRGCPYKCIFCVWPAAMTGNDPDGTGKRTVRHYTPEYMEAFLTELVQKYGFKSIYFDDDTFNLGNSHVVKMCEVMRKVGVPWSAMCRADTSKMETWQLMKDSGCFGVKLGFESGNQYVVDQIVNKHLDLAYSADVVRHLKQIGMTVHGTFTFGLPGETPAQMQDTRTFIESLPFDSIQQSGCAEIEGTPLATLAETGELAAYAGAHMDSNYDRGNDGHQKFLKLAADLRRS